MNRRNQPFHVSSVTATIAATAVVAVAAAAAVTALQKKNANVSLFSFSSFRFLKFYSGSATATPQEGEEKDTPKIKENHPKKQGRRCTGITIRRNNNNIQWPTLVALYALIQLKPRHAGIALPLLCYYLLCDTTNNEDDDEEEEEEEEDNDDDDENDVDANENNIINNHTNNKKMMSSNALEGMFTSLSSSSSSRRQRSISVESQQSGKSSVVECSGSGEQQQRQQQQQQRYVDMLVHNVSHTDLVLCLGIPNGGDLGRSHHETTATVTVTTTTTATECDTATSTTSASSEDAHALCRPRFSAFDLFCQKILRVLETCQVQRNSSDDGNGGVYSSIMSFPRYERSDSSSRFSLVTPKPSRRTMLPVGFNLWQLVQECKCSRRMGGGEMDVDDMDMDRFKRETLEIDNDDLTSLRVRGRDMAKMEAVIGTGGYRTLALSPKRIRNNEQVAISDLGHEEEKGKEDVIVDNDGDDDDDDDSVNNHHGDKKDLGLHLEAVFFPLLSSLLRRWHNQMMDKYGPSKMNHVKKVLILVSGVGTPRNWTHSKTGNSTEACAKLMEIFIKVLYPDVVVVRLHSEREIFRYDENIAFANKELLPCIDAYRDAHARGEAYPDEIEQQGIGDRGVSSKTFDTDWKQTFALTLSFADGAPARTYAIQSSLRPYRPTYFHFWQLKTFWHDSKICDEDIEVHSFESMETVPPMEVRKTNVDVQMVVEEMKRFRQDFLRTFQKGDNDIESFWLRKTKKPVLAVLLVNLPDKGLTMYRGTNMEVSMPTGSLCAERNVIGTALATNPGLRREELMMVAVLAIPLPKERLSTESPSQIPSPPMVTTSNKDASAKEAAFFFSEVERNLSRYQRPENCRRSMSIGSFASIVEDGGSNDTDDSSWENMSGNDPNLIHESPVRGVKPSRKLSASELTHVPSFMDSQAGTPVRKIKLYEDAGIQESVKDDTRVGKCRRKKSRTVVVHSSEDINPLKPCGACNEWLKKIAESNPYFKVITFTDTDCNGVYVTPCQE